MSRSHWVRVGGFFIMVAVAAGCGSSYSVSGHVTFEGQPVEEGWITFTPADGKGTPDGAPIAAGRYQVKGLLPGKKIVHIDAVKKVPAARSSDDMRKMFEESKAKGDASGLIDPADILPANTVGNDVEVVLNAGQQTRDFELKKPAQR